jgi:uncharacterized protein HemX
MKSLVTLVLGLAVGGGVGVWYGGHHPEAAAAEQRDALEARLKVAETATDQTQRELEARAGKPDTGHLVSTATLKQIHDEEQTKVADLQAQLGTTPANP